MYTLYGSPSTAGTAIHWLLLELNESRSSCVCSTSTRPSTRRSDYLALNPDGVVPTLIVDGAPITQMAGIATLLAERHPEAGFAPPPGSPERGEYLSWTLWLANSFQPNFRAWFYPHEPAGGDAQEAVKATARVRIEAGLAIAWTRAWRIATILVGDQFQRRWTCWPRSCAAGRATCPSRRRRGRT
jgi:glutathione S-transferase